MALRKQTNPREMDLQPEMRDILLRNGMQAHVIANGDGYQLAVQGHDSPLLTYNLTQKQMLALTDWGTNTANKKAWNVFTSIVGNDFDMPRNFVHARNANGRVAMGLHGYRVGVGEYGRTPVRPMAPGRPAAPGMWGPNILGWTPRRQDGFHLRRVGGQVFYQGAPMVAERPDRRLKPGELSSGSYGFYYKGQQSQQQSYSQQNVSQSQQQASVQQDVLQDLQSVITPIQPPSQSQGPATPYKELITSDVYFTNEKWQECLESHGITIDAEKKMIWLPTNYEGSRMSYYLTDDQVKALTDNSIKNTPVAQRLAIINNICDGEFAEKVTMDMLNSTGHVSLTPTSDLQQYMQQSLQQRAQFQQRTPSQENVLQGLQSVATPIQQIPRSQDPAKPYNELIASDENFSNEKWQEVLASHGIIVDEQAKTLTIQSTTIDADMVYSLTDDEVKALTDNSIENTPVAQRLDIINNVISDDFDGKIKMDDLNSTERVGLSVTPDVLWQLFQQTEQETKQQTTQQEQVVQSPTPQETIHAGDRVVDGRDLTLQDENKYFAREGKHGREVEVTSISVEKLPDENEGNGEGKGKSENTYRMTAIINGVAVNHDINQKQYDKFLALDDYHRMKLFAKVFPEVELKDRPGTRSNIGAKILGALTAGAVVAGEVAFGRNRPFVDDGPAIRGGGPHVRVFGKHGVDTPDDIAARKFEAIANHAANDMRNGRGL